MTQEDKQLLLKDLCARLPYGVIVDYKENEFETPHWKITTIYPETLDGWIGYDKRVGAGSDSGSRPFKIGEVKPYLRPMSSMTEEEKNEFNNLFNGSFQYFNQGVISASHLWDRNEAVFVGELDCTKLIDWFLEHHFDFRGLIPMGLALEAPKDMYKAE